MRRIQWINPALMMVAIMLATAGSLYAQAPATRPSPERELQAQEAALSDRNAPAQARDQAAQRLVSRSTVEANRILLQILDDPANREGRLAVARALGNGALAKPNPQFITPLARLLGDDREMTAAAAQALATYRDKDGDRARDELAQFAKNRRQLVRPRAAAIRAMGKLVDKRTVDTLIQLLGDENSLIRDAAIDALLEMTGLTAYGRDRQRWINWWNNNRNRDEADWAADLLNKNAARAAKLEGRIAAARRDLVELITDEYQRTPAEERVKKIKPRLESESDDVRWAAVAVLHKEIREKGGVGTPPEVLESLRAMIGDSFADVRCEVARSLEEASDAAAVDGLLAQLAQENDPDVQAAILKALGPMRDMRAANPLLQGLNSESFTVAQAAAESLRSLATHLLRDPAHRDEARRVAQALVAKLNGATDSSAEGLRESLVEAMAALGDPSSLRTFQTLCVATNREQAQVRRYAVRGIAKIGDRESTGIVINVLGDPDRAVRLEALDALKELASWENAEAIARLLNPRYETDSTVRERAWDVLAVLFEKAPISDLQRWADRFRDETELNHKRRLRIFQVMEKKLDGTREARKLALCRQNLAQELLSLDKPDEAAPKFRLALDYFKSVNAPASDTDFIELQLLKAMLRAKQYADAATFATEVIAASGDKAEPMGQRILEEVNRLKSINDYDSALKLITQMKSLPLGSVHKEKLASTEEEIRRLKSGQSPTGMRPVRHANRTEQAANSVMPAV